METDKRLTEAEFTQMINLLHRYVEQTMDQWELWKFNTDRAKTYVKISYKSEGPEEAYLNLDHLIEKD